MIFAEFLCIACIFFFGAAAGWIACEWWQETELERLKESRYRRAMRAERCRTCAGTRFVEVGPNYHEACPACLNTDGCVCGKLRSGEASFCAVHSCDIGASEKKP